MENYPPNPSNQDFSRPGTHFNPAQHPGAGQGGIPVPNSTAVLVLGIISVVVWLCYGVPGMVCAIIALVLAKKGNEAYNENPSLYTQASYQNLKAGKICGIIGLILGILMILFLILYILFIATMFSGLMRLH